MPRWTTRWLGWARDKLFRRVRPRVAGILVGHERAGVVRWDAPIPWTADSALVEVRLRLPPAARRKNDFALRLSNLLVPADGLRADAGDFVRASFRFPVPDEAARAEVLWNGRVLVTVLVPALTPGVYLASLTVNHTAVAVRFGATTASATAFVPDRCDGLIALGVLRSPLSLAHLAELGLKAVFRDPATGDEHAAPVVLSAAQAGATEAQLIAVCPVVPRRLGAWEMRWAAGARVLASQCVNALPAERFAASVRVHETRFAVLDVKGAVRTTKVPPALADAVRLGPCFVLAGGEPGAAALCRFELVGLVNGEPDPEIRCEADAVVTDGPAVFVPALFDAVEMGRVSGFELRLNGRVLGTASLRPVPAARLTGEGGFVPPPEFTWSAAADDELADRLKRLQ